MLQVPKWYPNRKASTGVCEQRPNWVVREAQSRTCETSLHWGLGCTTSKRWGSGDVAEIRAYLMIPLVEKRT